MENGERPVPGGRDDWRVKLATCVGMLVGASVALFVIKPLVDIPEFWLKLIAFLAVTGAGGVLGQVVGWLLFRRPPG